MTTSPCLRAAALAALATLALAACDRETTAQVQRDTKVAGQKVENALERTGQHIAAAGDKAQQKIAAATTPQAMGDAAITASVKADILKDPDLSVLKIDVDTVNGVVTLKGVAKTADGKSRAEKLAGAIKGVKEVRNQLAVERG
jgi:hyperosmotically inducible protein